MRRIVVFLVLVGLFAVMTACSESPHDVGFNMAQKHMEGGMNPSPAEKVRMQRELSGEIQNYSLADKQAFMQGYLEAVTDVMQQQMQATMLSASR